MKRDDAMDTLNRQLFAVLLDGGEWTHGVQAAVDAALLGRFYERFADHAVEIGRRVVFQVTGSLPRSRRWARTSLCLRAGDIGEMPADRRQPGLAPHRDKCRNA